MATCQQCGSTLADSTADVCPKCLLGLGVTTQIDTPLQPGMEFHGLEIVQMLGRGGMGVVYKARQKQLDRFVALKVLLRALANNNDFTQRFEREAKTLAALNHPNIVAIYDFGKEDGQYFLVMEYVDGGSLRALLKQDKLPSADALKIIPVLCEALEYAHAQGVVHRDIKPENILIDKAGRVRIADFGLAKMLGAEQPMPSMTQTDVAMGTPHYMAPEQYQSAKSVDHRADIYSMGVLFYEMLTGDLPVGRFAPPSQHVQVDVRLDQIVLRALEREPDRRYQKMSDVRRDVSELSSAPKANNAIKRSVGLALGLTACLLGVAALVFALRDRPKDAASETTQPAPSPTPATRVEADPWDQLQLASADVPAEWRISEVETGDTRGDIFKAARWWGLDPQAAAIQKFRRTVLAGPQERSVQVYVYNCRDAESRDACIAALYKRFYPYPNRFLIDKGNLFVFGSADRDGRITPVVEQLEDTLRQKLGLSSAKREDPTTVKPDFLPAGWTHMPGEVNGVRAPLVVEKDTATLLSALGDFPKPSGDDLRDGWIKCYGDAAKGVTARFISLRFFESEPATRLAEQLRSTEAPRNQELRVLNYYERVVVATCTGASDEFQQLIKKLAAALGSGSDGFRIVAEAAPPSFKGEKLQVPLTLTGINARELTRDGRWKVEVWGNHESEEFALTPPPGLSATGGSLQVILDLPSSQKLTQVLGAKGFNLRMTWNAAGGSFDVSVPELEKER
jgi:tRNA A-37 threonylcarbamoyl transferase component Bud32